MSEEAVKRPEKVVQRVIEDEMKSAYIDYAMSVIVGRALPDIRDGLKPVHRRILFAMHEMGLQHNKPFKKSATVVGMVLGRYHPHGDSAVYDAMVRMAQDFSLRYPLVKGQGNFGSVDGDNAAAYRYTEAKLTKLAEEMLQDIEKETVPMVDNFDGSLKEPTVLPAKAPNLLINGTSGIAVGMATNIPPHNLNEVADGTIAFIENQDISPEQLMHYIKGPDFPTAGIIEGKEGIKEAYKTGRGKLKVKAVAEIQEDKGKERIIVTEIPYQVNKSDLLEEIANNVKDKKIEGISDLRDESDREGMRIVIELKKDANANVVLNQLYAYTKMSVTFGVNVVALVNNEPKTLNLRDIVKNFVLHRQNIVRKRTEFDLKKSEERQHILEGLIIALNNIDDVVSRIKKSKTVEEAKEALMSNYSFTEIQAKSILDMKLQKLSSMEQTKIRDEHKQLGEIIVDLRDILVKPQRILNMIKSEMHELKANYGDERRTKIIEAKDEEVKEEALIKEEDMVITISHKGYIKRLPVNTYRQQGRGGVGIKAVGTREEDFIEDVFIASTHSYVLFFTNKGKVYWQKVHHIPEASRQAAGKPIINMIQIDKEERIQAYVPVKSFENNFLALVTKNGVIKKTSLEEYSRPRQGGIIAVNLDEGDELVSALLTDGNKQIMIATANGMAAKFHESDAREIGRTSRGVRAITLKDRDEVVGTIIADDDKTILTVTENGYGKRTKISEYRLIGRGGIGVKNIICSERNGNVISVKAVEEDDDVMLMSKDGITIRIPVQTISCIGRNTQGVRLMKLREEDKAVAVAKIVNE